MTETRRPHLRSSSAATGSMKRFSAFGVAFLAGLTVMFVLDFMWHVVLLPDFYFNHLRTYAWVSGDEVSPLLPYLLAGQATLVAGVLMFVVRNLPRVRRLQTAAWRGLLFGLVTVGLHLLINASLIKGFDTATLLIDTARGVVFVMTVALLATWLIDTLGGSQATS